MFEYVLFTVTGAALYGGTHHLYRGIQNRSGHPHAIHAAMYFLLAGFALIGASTNAIHSVAELSVFSKISVSLGILLFAALPWFIAILLQQHTRTLPALLTCAWGILLLVNIASPYSLLYQNITAFKDALPSGQSSVAILTDPNPAWHLAEVAMLSTLIFSMYLCVQQYRKTRDTIVVAPVAGLLLLLCTTLFDFFVHANLIYSAYLAPMGFLLFLVAVNLYRKPVQPETRQQAPEDKSRYQLTLNFNQAPVHNWQTVSTGKSMDTSVDTSETAATVETVETVEKLAHQQTETPRPFFKTAEFEPHAEFTEAVETDSKAAEMSPEPPPVEPQQDAMESPELVQLDIENPAVDLVSDGLVDIAVRATLIMKRLEHGDLNARELRELSRKIRTQAIETRRITYQMLRTKHFESKINKD